MTQTVASPAAASAAPVLDDLEALFDQVAAQREASEKAAATAVEMAPPHPARPVVADPAPRARTETAEPAEVFERLGHLTRQLHDALRELGYEKGIEEAVGSLPDARSRLSYIATLTGQAAERVLAATERGQEAVAEVERASVALAARWEQLFAGNLGTEAFRTLALETRAFLAAGAARAAADRERFTDIMMAQDFHDLTGQVIQRVVGVAETLEKQLVKLLLESTPPERRPATEAFLSGPAVPGLTQADVVTGQEQVDDLLESLGF